MGFVNEVITDEDKSTINWQEFRNCPFAENFEPWKWTIDREHEAFLVMLVGRGREGEHPEVYAFSWKGNIVFFDAKRGGKGTFSEGMNMFWEISNVKIPANIVHESEEVICLLQEAVRAHGSIYRSENINSVHIEII